MARVGRRRVYFDPADFFAPAALVRFAAFGGLPMTPFSGQILNAGHFSQPATTAIGHNVMATLRLTLQERSDFTSTSRARKRAERQLISSYSGSVRNSAKASCVLIFSKICAARS